MRRIAIGAVGTRGDVAPAIALGGMLAGSAEIVLVAPPENRAAAERSGLRFLALGQDFSGVVARGNLKEYREQIRLQFREHGAEFEAADAIIGFSLFYAGSSLAQRSGARYDHVFYTPQVFRSRILPPPSARDMSAPQTAIAAAWRRHEAQENFILKRLINDERKLLGLEPLRSAGLARSPERAILAVDPGIARPPADVAGVRQAHYWRLPDIAEPDESLRRFLDEGAAPLLMSLGSVSRTVRRSYARLHSAAAALVAEGERVILIHPEAPASPKAGDKLLEARFVPFGAVLPRCKAIAHQGGIGTLFAAALAGLPQLILPCMLDQFFWASRIEELGLGLDAKGPKALADGRFAVRLRALVESETIRGAASAFSAALAAPERERSLRSRIAELFG